MGCAGNVELFSTGTCSEALLILLPQWDLDAAGSWKAFLPSALVESNQGGQKQNIQQPGPCYQETSALNSNAVSAGMFYRSHIPAPVVQQSGEG